MGLLAINRIVIRFVFVQPRRCFTSQAIRRLYTRMSIREAMLQWSKRVAGTEEDLKEEMMLLLE